MLVRPSCRQTLMARLRRLAITRGRRPADGGGILGERGVTDVMEPVLDLPVAADEGRDPGSGRRAGWEAGKEVQPLDRDLLAGQVLAPAHDAQGLTGAGIVEVPERGCLQVTDLEPAPAPGAALVVQGDVGPRGVLNSLNRPGWLTFTTAM